MTSVNDWKPKLQFEIYFVFSFKNIFCNLVNVQFDCDNLKGLNLYGNYKKVFQKGVDKSLL